MPAAKTRRVAGRLLYRQELGMPPGIGARPAAGFAIQAVPARLNGRGGERREVAKTNLFREVAQIVKSAPWKPKSRPGC